MVQPYGTVITGLITDENAESYFVQKDGQTYALDKSDCEAALALGQTVQGFVYENSQRKKRMTTKLPNSRVGRYGWGEVTSVRKDLGVFVNIGLADKEIAVSLDDLPQLTQLWPKKGDRLMISLTVDKKDRIWGKLADEAVFRSVAKKGSEQQKNHNIEATVFRLKMVGTYLLTDDYYLAFLHPSERIDEPRLGERVTGRVIGVRPDGLLNMSLRPRAYEAISDDAAMLLAMLEQAPQHQLPFSDKSSPDEIMQYFGISKGQFKRAVGHLLKARRIVQQDGKLILKDESHGTTARS